MTATPRRPLLLALALLVGLLAGTLGAAAPAGAAAPTPLPRAELRALVPLPSGYAAGSPDTQRFGWRRVTLCPTGFAQAYGSNGVRTTAFWEDAASFGPAPSVSYAVVQFTSVAKAKAVWNMRLAAMTTRCAGTRTANLDAIGGTATVRVRTLARQYGAAGIRQDVRWRVAYAEGYTPGPVSAELVLMRLVGPAWVVVRVFDSTRATLTTATVARAKAALRSLSAAYWTAATS